MTYKDPARARAQRRNRENMKRASVSDVSAQQEMAMRQRVRKCPLCGVSMSSKPHLPNSKELDHIVPINQGGTHTHGNVRIICRKCNQGRPKDGSDYIGQVTLFAQDPDPAVSRKRTTCGNGLHPWVPENIVIRSDGKRRCGLCAREFWQKARRATPHHCQCGASFIAPGNTFMCPACIDAAGRRAAELHAGGLSWPQVAAKVGYTTAEGARYAAKRIGYQPPTRERRVPQRRVCADCGGPKQEGSRTCTACTTAKARQAVALRQDGCTLRYIADYLGFSSITSVTNLMKTVVTIEARYGRPQPQDPDLRRCPAA